MTRAVEVPWVDAGDQSVKGHHHHQAHTFGRQKALAASSDAKARVIQTGPSAGGIIPKEERRQSGFLRHCSPSSRLQPTRARGARAGGETAYGVGGPKRHPGPQPERGLPLLQSQFGEENTKVSPQMTRPVTFNEGLGGRAPPHRPGRGVCGAAAQAPVVTGTAVAPSAIPLPLTSWRHTVLYVGGGGGKEDNLVFTFSSSYLPFSFTKLGKLSKVIKFTFFMHSHFHNFSQTPAQDVYTETRN